MGFTASELVEQLSRFDLKRLCECLLNKREFDGINGRTWDAVRHYEWEMLVSQLLRSNDYSGHISHSDIKNNQEIQTDEDQDFWCNCGPRYKAFRACQTCGKPHR